MARIGILAFLLLVVLVGFGNDKFLTTTNWSSLLDQAAPVAATTIIEPVDKS